MTEQALSPEIQISSTDFERFREYFYRKTGIRFENSKRYFVDKRLSKRILATDHTNFREYFMFMRFQASQAEFQEVVNIMTVNETYFFREEYQFKCLVGPILDDVVARSRGRDVVRIWSIPCSTGEEPYSIALYLLEKWPHIEQVDVQIQASDIDTTVLSACRRGIFSERSVQHLPPAILRKHFIRYGDHGYQISEDVRGSVDFTQINLSDPAQTSAMRDFDVIFCRNLLIYFDDVSRRQAAETFYDALKPGGFVLLGHSESMSRMSSLFKVRRFDDGIAYQKPMK